MLWHAIPPELNTARLLAGAGPTPMLQAAEGWSALAAAAESQAGELAATLASLKELWSGAGSERAIAAVTPMVAWLQTVAQQAQRRGLQATAQAAAYMKALAMTPSLPEIAVNHITHAVLAATNFLGINLVPIGFNETDYFVRMWNQAAGSMDLYQAETAANIVFEPPPPIKAILQPGVIDAFAEGALGRLSQVAGKISAAAPAALSELEEAVGIPLTAPDAASLPAQLIPLLNQAGQLSGPMQQLMQPIQQITSMAGQAGGPGTGLGAAGLGGPGDAEPGQLGLLGASPLSNHPLAGGSGPSVGLGLMHAEALPGAGGSAARTALMSQLIDKPGLAGAGSGAMGGAAPMGMMGSPGQGAPSGAGPRPGLATPALLAPGEDESAAYIPAELDDQDDW